MQLFAKTTPALQVKKLILIVLSNWYSSYQKQCTVRISLVKNKLENNYLSLSKEREESSSKLKLRVGGC